MRSPASDGDCVQRQLFVLRLAYDGGDFRGWQAQPSMRTVQGVVEAALSSLLGEGVRVHGAARTDAGVHARGQVAHFSLRPARLDQSRLIDPLTFLPALAAVLPETLRPLQFASAPLSFHARASAVGKHYCYRFSWGAARPAATFHLGTSAAPDWERARAALRGLADLTQLPGLSSPSTDRRPAPALDAWQLDESEGGAALQIRAPGFRKHQVRNLAGHLAAVALGLATPETLSALAARQRPWMGATAPPHGLCLEEVIYPDAQNPFPRGRLPGASVDSQNSPLTP